MNKLKILAMILWLTMLVSFINLATAQTFVPLDNAQHDIVYFRAAGNLKPQVKVVYGRPIADSDEVFGKEIPYGKIWRTGANEATEIKFYQDVMFANKFVKAGTYVLYTIPGKNYWTVILNSNTDSLGAYFYDESKDLARIDVPANQADPTKIFTIAFDSKNYGAQLVMAWGLTRIKVPVYLEQSLLSDV
jgi:hypothetical protein